MKVENAVIHLKTMGFFRKPMTIHVANALKRHYGHEDRMSKIFMQAIVRGALRG